MPAQSGSATVRQAAAPVASGESRYGTPPMDMIRRWASTLNRSGSRPRIAPPPLVMSSRAPGAP